MFLLCVFFFQAEDGIRDLVRSRGLGDVYKRQFLKRISAEPLPVHVIITWTEPVTEIIVEMVPLEPVSYTHLTLPTSDLV